MAGNAIMEMLFLFLIAFYYSDTSYGWELRKLVGVDLKDNVIVMHDSPLPTPAPADNKLDPKPINETEKKKTDPPFSNETEKVVPVSEVSNSSVFPAPPPLAQTNNEKVNPKGSSNSTSSSPPPIAKRDDEKDPEIETKNEGRTILLSDTNESCDDINSSVKCKDEGDIVACISEIGPKYLVVLVQNGGDSSLKVNVFMDTNLGDIEVPKQKTEKINISLISSESAQLTLNAGKRDCVLHTGTLVPEEKMFPQLPSYNKIFTPLNGAYFLVLAVIIYGGIWTCCKLRNKKRHDGVAYQELEMAMPDSVQATGVDTSEGWDQGWDDDWNDDLAVMSPGRQHAGSISANGLTSRSSIRDGWENNWED